MLLDFGAAPDPEAVLESANLNLNPEVDIRTRKIKFGTWRLLLEPGGCVKTRRLFLKPGGCLRPGGHIWDSKVVWEP